MSGYKRATITISQEEYRRLHDADMQRRFKSREKSSGKQKSRQMEALKTAYRQVESRQDHYERLLENLDDDIREIEGQAAQDLITAQAAFYENIIAEINKAAGETESSLTVMLDGFREDIEREKAEYRKSLQECVDRIDAGNAADANKHAFANHWIAQSSAMYDFIIQEYDTNHFVPGRLEKIARRLELAHMNLDYGMPESALPTAQLAYWELSDLRIELEAKTLEWQNLFTHAYSALSELDATIVSNSRIPALDTEGNELPILIDVNHWSAQKYQTLLELCRGLYRRLSKHHQEIDTEELHQIVESDIPGIRSGLDAIMYEARLNAIQAQIRANIAELALQALAIQGFTLVEAGYAGNDANASYDVRLLNRADGIAVEVKVVPQAGQNYASDIIVISEDSTMKTEHELRARFNEIRSTLAKYGLTVGPTQTLPNPPDSPATTADRKTAENRQSLNTEIVQDVRAD